MASGSLDASVGLLVAAFELKAVQLVRAAMAGGGPSAEGERATPLGPKPNPEPRRHHRPAAVYEPRRHIEPKPRLEPRPVIHLRARVEPSPVCTLPPAPCEPESVRPISHPSPIQPPWKVRPWENPPLLPPKIKIILNRPDIQHKGSLIDKFI